VQTYIEEEEGQWPLGRPIYARKCEANVNVDRKEMGPTSVGWIQLFHDTPQWHVLGPVEGWKWVRTSALYGVNWTWDLRSSGILRGVVFTDVSGQRIGPIFTGQESE
jgi:hypothetical protein